LKVSFKATFAEDLKGLKEKLLLARVNKLIETVERAGGLMDLPKVKKLQGGDGYYRIRLGDYRVGIVSERDEVIFVRILHRKEIYRYFP